MKFTPYGLLKRPSALISDLTAFGTLSEILLLCVGYFAHAGATKVTLFWNSHFLFVSQKRKRKKNGLFFSPFSFYFAIFFSFSFNVLANRYLSVLGLFTLLIVYLFMFLRRGILNLSCLIYLSLFVCTSQT